MVDMKTIKLVVKPAVLGTSVIVFTPMLGGILNSILSFIPSVTLGGISIPHGVIAAGTVAAATGWLLEKYWK